MDCPVFSKKIKERVKKFLNEKCRVKEPTDADVEESCRNLYFVGKAQVGFLLRDCNNETKIQPKLK